MAEEPPKKDLTSLIELSALELAKNPHLLDGIEGGEGSIEAQAQEKVSEADFGNLEEMSREAALHAEANPTLDNPPEPQMAAPDAGIAMVETSPGESPATAPEGEALPEFNLTDSNFQNPESHPSFLDENPAQTSSSGSGPEIPGVGVPENDPALMAELASTDDAPVINVNEDPPANPAGIPAMMDASAAPSESTAMASIDSIEAQPREGLPEQQQQQQQEPAQETFSQEQAPVASVAPPAQPKTQLDPNRPPVQAAPVGADQAKKAAAAPAANQDLSALKKFGEKLAIGKPRIDGAPAFSVMIRNASGHFDEKTIKAIEDAITSEDFGIRIDDIAVQLSSGRLLVPQVSEFAAITLAQKLRDVVDNIELDLASEIFKSSANEVDSPDDSILYDTEEYETHREEVRDIGAEPQHEDDLFTTNLSALSEYQVTRILSVVMASEIIFAEVAENPSSKDFELVTEKLTRELIARAFKLGAHGVLGVNFTLKSIEAQKDLTGKVRRAYRLLGTGTAVRVRKK